MQVSQKVNETMCNERKIKDITSASKKTLEMGLLPCRKKITSLISNLLN